MTCLCFFCPEVHWCMNCRLTTGCPRRGLHSHSLTNSLKLSVDMWIVFWCESVLTGLQNSAYESLLLNWSESALRLNLHVCASGSPACVMWSPPPGLRPPGLPHWALVNSFSAGCHFHAHPYSRFYPFSHRNFVALSSLVLITIFLTVQMLLWHSHRTSITTIFKSVTNTISFYTTYIMIFPCNTPFITR